jgi:LysM repeat protein
MSLVYPLAKDPPWWLSRTVRGRPRRSQHRRPSVTWSATWRVDPSHPAVTQPGNRPSAARLALHGAVLSVVLASLPLTWLLPGLEVPAQTVAEPEVYVVSPTFETDELDPDSQPLAFEAVVAALVKPTLPPGPRLRVHRVEPGETLSSVAEQSGLNLDTLIWANELAEPDNLRVGIELLVPALDGVLHRVSPGDTLSELAAYYHADPQATAAANRLEPPYVILSGQRLLFPGGRMPTLVAAATSPSAPGSEAASLKPKPLPYPNDAAPEQAAFILSIAEAARASQRDTSVPASVAIAQAILETYWGSSRLARENQNFFGIKARERGGTDGTVWYNVWEVAGSRNLTSNEPFRAYKTMADSFVDHGRFFVENPRYAGALQVADDPRAFAREIARAGYATDPGYATKLIGLMDRFNLYAYDE